MSKNEKTVLNKKTSRLMLPLVVLFLVLLPVACVYDVVMFLVTRPTCLNCGSLVDFFRTQGLSMMMVRESLSSIGYRLKMTS